MGKDIEFALMYFYFLLFFSKIHRNHTQCLVINHDLVIHDLILIIAFWRNISIKDQIVWYLVMVGERFCLFGKVECYGEITHLPSGRYMDSRHGNWEETDTLQSKLTNPAGVLGLCPKQLCLARCLPPCGRPASFVGLNCKVRSCPPRDLLPFAHKSGQAHRGTLQSISAVSPAWWLLSCLWFW